MIKRQRAKLKASAEQSEEAQPRRQVIRAEEILIPELGIFADADPFRVQAGKRQERR